MVLSGILRRRNATRLLCEPGGEDRFPTAVLGVPERRRKASRAKAAMDSAYRHLVREDEGLVLLFAPPIDKMEPSPGYIKAMEDNTLTPLSGWRWPWRAKGKGNARQRYFACSILSSTRAIQRQSGATGSSPT